MLTALSFAFVPAAWACGYQVHSSPHGADQRGHRSALVIGDSTGIFATPHLGRRGLEGDSKECRQFGEGVALIRARRRSGRLPHLVVLALGANGPVSLGQVESALAAVGRGRVLGLFTPRNLASSAAAMRAAARRHSARVLLIDWKRFSVGRGFWFAGDGLHVNQAGAAGMARLISRRAAGAIAPPVRRLRWFARRRGVSCGTVRRFGKTLQVRILRHGERIRCKHARYIARVPPLRGFARWRWYDWRPARIGPWQDIYVRGRGHPMIATAPASS